MKSVTITIVATATNDTDLQKLEERAKEVMQMIANPDRDDQGLLRIHEVNTR